MGTAQKVRRGNEAKWRGYALGGQGLQRACGASPSARVGCGTAPLRHEMHGGPLAPEAERGCGRDAARAPYFGAVFLPHPMRSFLLAGLALLLSGCLPYSVGQTASTLAPGERAVSATMQFVPLGEHRSDPEDPYYDPYAQGGTVLPQLDATARFALDDRTDATARLIGGSGVSVAVKRRLTGADPLGPGSALVGGLGVVNLGLHAHLEAAYIVSGDERATVVPFGGLRAIQTIPLQAGAVSDRPTLGVFLGARLGSLDFGVSPEIGVFYDPSALGLRERDIIVVPSVTLHGRELLRYFF